MNQYDVWVRIGNGQTMMVRMQATHDYQIRQMAEAQYGSGNVLNYTIVNG